MEKKKILIIDDAPQNIQIAVEILKDKYTLSVATSAKKGLSMLEDGLNPDLILLDIVMPEMDGFEMCRKLKDNLNYVHIPIIFLTILENDQDMVKGLDLGAVDYVTKPFEPKVLRARVDTHIRLKTYQDKLLDNIKEKDAILMKQSKFMIMGEMFENITYEWKQPLSIISMISSTIKLKNEIGTLNDKSLDKLLDNVDTSVNELFDTVDCFRDFLIIDNPKEYFKVSKVVNNTLKLLDSKIKYEDIKIIKDLDSIELHNYKNDFIQVVMNILSYSIDNLDKKEKDKLISITSEIENENFIFIVNNNKIIMTDEIISKIFDKYCSLEEEENSSHLGLYLSKKIIEETLHGKFEVEIKNKKTIFKIFLPLDTKH